MFGLIEKRVKRHRQSVITSEGYLTDEMIKKFERKKFLSVPVEGRVLISRILFAKHLFTSHSFMLH